MLAVDIDKVAAEREDSNCHCREHCSKVLVYWESVWSSGKLLLAESACTSRSSACCTND